MDAGITSETSADIYQPTRCDIPDDFYAGRFPRFLRLLSYFFSNTYKVTSVYTLDVKIK